MLVNLAALHHVSVILIPRDDRFQRNPRNRSDRFAQPVYVAPRLFGPFATRTFECSRVLTEICVNTSYYDMLSSVETGKDAVQRPKKNRVVLPPAMPIASIRLVSFLTYSVSAASTIWLLIAKHFLACPRDIMTCCCPNSQGVYSCPQFESYSILKVY